MAFSVVIPARFQSSRLPGKPLLDLGGLSMLQRVYQQACKSDASQVTSLQIMAIFCTMQRSSANK